MNRSGSPRSSAGPLRSVLIVCVLTILVLSVLYFMKRVEANRLSKDLQLLNVEKRDTEEDLSSKLTDHLDKIESLTQEVSSLQTRLTACEDEKGGVLVEKDKVDTDLKSCQAGQTSFQKQALDAQALLQQTKTSHESVSSQLQHVQSDMTSVQAALTDAENELEECETENTQCQHSLASMSQEMKKCKEGKAASDQQVSSQQSQIQSLMSQVASLQSQTQNQQRLSAPQSPPQSSYQRLEQPQPANVPQSPPSFSQPQPQALNSVLQPQHLQQPQANLPAAPIESQSHPGENQGESQDGVHGKQGGEAGTEGHQIIAPDSDVEEEEDLNPENVKGIQPTNEANDSELSKNPESNEEEKEEYERDINSL